VRTPPVDVPVDTLSGNPGPKNDLICLLLGSTEPLPDSTLRQLYANRADYVAKYGAASERTIVAGFVLEQDRGALLAFSQPSRITSP
jgi:Alpha/beta hydrolase domain